MIPCNAYIGSRYDIAIKEDELVNKRQPAGTYFKGAGRILPAKIGPASALDETWLSKSWLSSTLQRGFFFVVKFMK